MNFLPRFKRHRAGQFDMAEASEPRPDLSSIRLDTAATPTPDKDLSTLQDVADIDPAFKALKVDWVGADAAVTACVAELEGSQFAVFVKRGQLDSDIFRAVLHRAQAACKGGNRPFVFTVAPVVLLTLVRERAEREDLGRRLASVGGNSAVRTGFRDLVAWAVRARASDLHLHVNENAAVSKVSVSIDGHYVTPEHLAMPTERMFEMLRVAWLDVGGGNGTMFDAKHEQQGRLYEVVDDRNYMLRWGSFIADTGPSVTLRILDLDTKVQAVDLADLGYLPSQIEQFERVMLSKGGGIILGGVPGSGKTVTNGQLIARLPSTRKVMTIEDPVESRIEGALQASVVRAIDGSDRETMLAKLMAIKRAAASDVLLGEIRDLLTGAAFQDIIQSGSNGYATLHVSSAPAIPQRLASAQIGIPRDVLGAPRMLKLITYQALLPVLCECRLPAEALRSGAPDAGGIVRDGAWWQRYLDRIERLYDFDSAAIAVRNSDGCPKCRATGIPELYGYAGRTVAAELFEPGSDNDALDAIRKGEELRLHQIFRARRTAAFDNANMDGKTAMECAVFKISQGIFDPRDVEPNFEAFETVEAKRRLERR